MGDEGPAYAVPDAVLFRNWGQLGQSNTRTLLLKNNSDEARQLYISYPFSTIFAIGIAGDGWTYNNAPAWAATIVPPRSAVKVRPRCARGVGHWGKNEAIFLRRRARGAVGRARLRLWPSCCRQTPGCTVLFCVTTGMWRVRRSP